MEESKLKRLNGESLVLADSIRNKLIELFPEIEIEGKIDFNKLKALLNEEIIDSNEYYSFTWAGKSQAIKEINTPTKATLKPVIEKSIDFDHAEHVYIEGENLEVLKILQKSYNNKIKMIYIDPPYNTGKDFIYKDNYKQNLKDYLLQTNQIDSEGNVINANLETNGRFHSDWLNMMYSRLKLARNLLTDDGVIFISIDDNELANLKLLCNEVFGEKNFVGQWNWFKSATPPNLSKKIKKNIEYILCYEKKLNGNIYKGLKKHSSSNNGLLNQTNRYATLTFPANVVQTTLEDGIYEKGLYGTSSYKIELHEDTEVKDGVFIKPVVLSAKFKWSQKKLLEEIERGTIISIKSKTFSPSYEKLEYAPEVPPNLINESHNVTTTENAGRKLTEMFGGLKVFDYPKPVSLIKYLMDFVCEKDDIILDFFSGSATTAHAVLEKNKEDGGNRKFILVQYPEPIDKDSAVYQAGYHTICDIGEQRIRLALEELGLDVGFKVFKLDDSNIKEWSIEFEDIVNDLDFFSNAFKKESSELDIVYEIMLKQGLELTYPINSFEVDGKRIYDIAFGNLFICLADKIDTNVAKAIIAKRDEYEIETSSVIFSDAGFDGNDSEKLNCIELLKDAGYPEDNLLTI